MTSRFRRRAASLLPMIAGLALLVLGGGLFWRGLGGDPSASPPTVAATPAVHKRAKHRGVPIEQVQLGQRVHVEDGYGEEDYEFGTDVDPPTWRKLTLRAEKPAGGHADVELLRPVAWLDERGAEVGGTVFISVPECGIDGDALVLAIGPCPPVKPGRGRVVTGTFRHSSGDVLDLYIEGVDPIGTTANHPFWSEDRQDFIRADQLVPGERVRTLGGTPRVTSIVPRASPQPVYNLEVQVAHVYHVTQTGVLVHNGTPCPVTGVGTYARVGGHHVHAKAAFKNLSQYSKSKGFSIIQKYMKSRGWDHQAMTNAQREFFNELAQSGRPNTLKEHTRIAVEALQAGGATLAEARKLVAESLRNLRAQGVRIPSNIPWNY